MNTMSFYEFRSENLSERKIEFLSSYYRQKCSNAYKTRKPVLLD